MPWASAGYPVETRSSADNPHSLTKKSARITLELKYEGVVTETVEEISERRRLVDQAREAWIKQLMDTSRRNNLLYFRDLKVGSLDVSISSPAEMQRLIAGDKVFLRGLVEPESDPRAGHRLREISRKARTNLEEKGLETMFLALNMATWISTDGGNPPQAAVLLYPIRAEGKSIDSTALSVQITGPPQLNLALLHALEEEHGLRIREEDLLSADAEENEDVSAIVSRQLLARCGHLKGFEIQPKAVIGNFSFQKLKMVEELERCGEQLAASDVVAALAGDKPARAAVAARQRNSFGAEVVIDEVPAQSEFMVLDADSSQQTVIHAIGRDMDGVIQGPPGCGKSQTIANAIASLVADGKKVLFVAEKRAALEAVFKRLQQTNLSHLCLDLHGASVSNKVVMQRIRHALEGIRRSGGDPHLDFYAAFEARRKTAVGHVKLMHSPISPFGITPFEMQAEFFRTAHARSPIRWRGPALQKLGVAEARQVIEVLREARSVETLFSHREPSPWTEANLSSGEDVEMALNLCQKLVDEVLPQLAEIVERFESEANLAAGLNLDQLSKTAALVSAIRETCHRYDPAVFGIAPSLATSLSSVEKGAFARTAQFVVDRSFRKAIREAKRVHLIPGRVDGTTLTEIRKAAGQVQAWQGQSRDAALPRLTSSGDALVAGMHELQSTIEALSECIQVNRDSDLEELRRFAYELLTDSGNALKIPRVRALERSVHDLGAGSVHEHIRKSEVSASQWTDFFQFAWVASIYDYARQLNPSLASFDGETHSGFVDEFRQLDRDRIKLAAHAVKRNHAQLAIDTMNTFPEQAALVKGQALRKARHLPLRKLLATAPDVLTAVCPCWMSSPLNVSHLLPHDKQVFDVVIFDEASQILPQDAVCSIIRGRRLVVAGDRHQLPPTTFFADGFGLDEEDEESAVAGYESILDQLSAFIEPWQLEWHYRSRDERLIAFSNRHIYGDRLTTFPGVGGRPSISHVLVSPELRDGEEESSSAEVHRAVDLIISHAQATPGRSLGVITMGIKHARRIEAALDRVLDVRSDLDEFFNPEKDERFFVKSIEQVQGDERDAIILSVGYGKDFNGNLP